MFELFETCNLRQWFMVVGIRHISKNINNITSNSIDIIGSILMIPRISDTKFQTF